MAKAKKKTPKKPKKARKKAAPKKKAKKRGPKRGVKSPGTPEGRAKAGQSAAKHTRQISDTGLTDQQVRFVDEYVVHLNATKAAKLAGYSETTAGSIGTNLLSHSGIRELLAQKMDERNRRLEIAADRVLLELASGAFVNLADVVSWKSGIVTTIDSDQLTRAQVAAMKCVEQKFNRKGDIVGMKISMHDKPRYLELLMRHMGMLDPTGRQDTKGTIVEFMDRLRNGKDE
jgi:phage terminase small subunit